jgi:hypothetical protein
MIFMRGRDDDDDEKHNLSKYDFVEEKEKTALHNKLPRKQNAKAEFGLIRFAHSHTVRQRSAVVLDSFRTIQSDLSRALKAATVTATVWWWFVSKTSMERKRILIERL